MPYTFDQIEKNLSGDKKKNIFDPNQQTEGLGLTGTQSANTGSIAKTSSTAISAPSKSVTTSTNQPPPISDINQSGTERRQSALETSGQNAPIPPSLRGLESSLSEKESAIDTGAEEYLKPFSQTDYGLEPGTIEKAVTGDEPSFQKIAGLLGSGIPEAPKGFDLPDLKTPGIADIQTPGGLEQYLRRQAGPQYTAGEGAYDVATLSRSPNFLAAATNLGQRQASLLGRAGNLALDLPTQAQDILGQRLLSAQEAARTGLTGYQTELDKAILDQLAAAEAEREALRLPGRFGGEAAAEAVRARTALADKTPDELELDRLILSGELGIDPAQFYTVGNDPLSREMVTTPEQALEWNRIMDLLGMGGEAAVAGELPGFSSFDAAAYEKALLAAARAEKDRLIAEQQAQIDDIASELPGGEALGVEPEKQYPLPFDPATIDTSPSTVVPINPTDTPITPPVIPQADIIPAGSSPIPSDLPQGPLPDVEPSVARTPAGSFNIPKGYLPPEGSSITPPVIPQADIIPAGSLAIPSDLPQGPLPEFRRPPNEPLTFAELQALFGEDLGGLY